jgi:hypothetical protein
VIFMDRVGAGSLEVVTSEDVDWAEWRRGARR